jgi:hypothetical protein
MTAAMRKPARFHPDERIAFTLLHQRVAPYRPRFLRPIRALGESWLAGALVCRLFRVR